MTELFKFTVEREELNSLKRELIPEARFVDRISLMLAVQLAELRHSTAEVSDVLNEIENMEAGIPTATPLRPFTHAPLKPLWHKHFSTSRHMLRNIGNHWQVDKAKQKNLENLIAEIMRGKTVFNSEMAGELSHRFVFEALSERAKDACLTGDWIVIGLHGGMNYYLAIATHEESGHERDTVLFDQIRRGCAAEFPFLFPQSGDAPAA